MIDLYFWPTPNCYKISILLESAVDNETESRGKGAVAFNFVGVFFPRSFVHLAENEALH